ncbi:unnamed protein product [Calypogeia fissa]
MGESTCVDSMSGPTKPVTNEVSKSAPNEPNEIESKVAWDVESYLKDIQYFHNVIGLSNEGKNVKELSVDEVPISKIEEHFGLKAGKNGYKKEGVKGIPAEDIHVLSCALDGIEKFQRTLLFRCGEGSVLQAHSGEESQLG